MKGKSLTTLGPGADRINVAYTKAMQAAGVAIHEAAICGLLLLEQKVALPHGQWLPWLKLNCPKISDDTARRWMQAAERSARATGLPTQFISNGKQIPLSQVIAVETDDELPKDAKAARQTFFEFVKDKSLKELMGVIIEGDDAHRITRAHNGRTKGGTRGENRKDYPKFIGENLKATAAHLKSWSKYTAGQLESVETKLKSFIAKCPTPFLELLAKLTKDELKTR